MINRNQLMEDQLILFDLVISEVAVCIWTVGSRPW